MDTDSGTPRGAARRAAVDTTMAKVLSHPLRQDILAVLNEEVASPREIADRLGERLANVSYHVRELRDRNLIELVDTQPRRGAVEHFYRALQRPVFSDQDFEHMPVSTRRTLFDRIIRRTLDDIRRSGQSGGFDDVQTHVSRTTLTLDENGWSELSDLLTETYQRALAIQASSGERLAEADREERITVSSQLIMMHFRNPPA